MSVNALVQGASRGLGLQFCRALLGRNDFTVIATCRRPENAIALHSLQESYGNRLNIVKMDITKEEEIQSACAEISSQEYAGKGIDLLINSAGIIHPTGKGETSLRDVSQDDVTEVLKVDAIGPLLVVKHFAPLLTSGGGCFGTQSTDKRRRHVSMVMNLSARIGSIGDNRLGGWYSYRMAKTALNMMNKSLSIELARGKNKVICVNVHPGTVDTDLTRRYHRNLPPGQIMTPENSVSNLLSLAEDLTLEDSGKYLAYDGSEIEW